MCFYYHRLTIIYVIIRISFNYFLVVQKAFIEVNEDGTEAAAATAVPHMVPLCRVKSTRFTCDRPFMFMIRDNLTGVTLFSGHITDPTSQ